MPAQPLATRLRTLLSNQLLDSKQIDAQLFRSLLKMDWNASIDPAGSGETAVKYLGRYVQRSVISDRRVLAIEGEQVCIRIKNRDSGESEPLRMKGVEFIRRYLLHALPKGFHRIRYRGFLHARGKSKQEWLQLLLDARLIKKHAPPKSVDSLYVCRRCGTAMQAVNRLTHAPPTQRNEHFCSMITNCSKSTNRRSFVVYQQGSYPFVSVKKAPINWQRCSAVLPHA